MNDVREVDVVTACFPLMSHGLRRDLGGFDESFFMAAEEADLCLRAIAQYGGRPALTPEAVIIHCSGALEKVKADRGQAHLRQAGPRGQAFPRGRRWLARHFLIGMPLTRHLSSGLAAVCSAR